MPTKHDRVMLKILDHRTKEVFYICVSKITSITAMGATGCIIRTEDDPIPYKVSSYSADDILISCGFETVEAKHQ